MIEVQPNGAHLPWLAVMQGLAGGAPSAFWGSPDTPQLQQMREHMKTEATAWRAEFAEPIGPAFRAPYWVMHAYAHWWKAWLALYTAWDADEYDETFPYGMDFRRYLGAWLHSVGMAKLGMTAADVEAVHQMTGVAMLPHELLPCGFSEFRHEPITRNPPTLDEVLAASAESKA